jgi:hypothetical protein
MQNGNLKNKENHATKVIKIRKKMKLLIDQESAHIAQFVPRV